MKRGWAAAGTVVSGLCHVRGGAKCQDAIKWEHSDGRIVMAIADGHGGHKHFRSDRGAQLAVETACRLMLEDDADGIVRAWVDSVLEDVKKDPFTPEESNGLERIEGPLSSRAIAETPALAYGTTLVAVMVSEGSVLCFQLGDGDILFVSPDGDVRQPFGQNGYEAANETFSLAMTDAQKEYRIKSVPVSEEDTALILLATDGYEGSFPSSRDDFLKIGPDYLAMIRDAGIERVAAMLDDILSETTRRGSGDDITLGILSRV